MARKTMRAALVLTGDEKALLKELAGSRTAPVREAQRAKVLLGYAQGASITDLSRLIGLSRPAIYKCIDKALAAGVRMGLKDAYHRPHEPEITDEARAWVVGIACTKPKDHGLAAELWSISALARFVSERAAAAGCPRLAHTGKSTVWRTLAEHDIQHHKPAYQLGKQDTYTGRAVEEAARVHRGVPLEHGATRRGVERPQA